jgi:hypothetical protein
MSEKKTPYYIPSFLKIIFYTQQSWICQYFLKEDFKLIVVLSSLYSKFSSGQLLKFNKYLLKSYSMHWFRVSFRGKGFRLRKFKSHNKVTLNFGHSHWAKIALKTDIYFFKKLKRQNYICCAKNYFFYKAFKLKLKFFKSLNMYTKRGLRLKKQYIQKRFGKISQVVSSLH